MSDIAYVQQVPAPAPQAHMLAHGDEDAPPTDDNASLARLQQFAQAQGDISDHLTDAELTELGTKAIREWDIDKGSRQTWTDDAERFLSLAAQEGREDDEREPIWEDGADVHYPLLTVATQQFAARAMPELIKGDKVVGVKVFDPPQPPQPPKAPPQGLRGPPGAPPGPMTPQAMQMAQAAQAQAQQQAQAAQMAEAQTQARNARGERVSHYMNYLVFYRMEGWEGETDALIHELPNLGSAFKKIYFSSTGLQSDFVSAVRLTVHRDTKSIYRCPRITQDFEVYPYEIEERMRDGTYRFVDAVLEKATEDEQKPRTFIEQHRIEDLDQDGLGEPYVVTVDVETQAVVRVEPAYTQDDVMLDGLSGRVIRIERWLPYPEFTFLPDPKGRYYGIGFGRLLESITDSIDTSLNQLIDAGTAEIAGGGFIAGNVRLQGEGQGGAFYVRPGEYGVVNTTGPDLKGSIWERTVPHPSPVTFQLLELLLAAAKDIASVKDVITGEAPSTAPVGTTLALQNQALQVFSSIYKRIYRGFRDEYRLMYRALKRWATDKEKREYRELTGGDFDQDFSGDGTDIQPVADPSVVGKMQKMARLQAIQQWAISEVGQAAGMLQPGPAQKLTMQFLDDIDVPQPASYIADIPPNPMALAEVAEKNATAQLRTTEAQTKAAKLPSEVAHEKAETTRVQTEALEKLGNVAEKSHQLHQEADRIARQGTVATPEQMMNPAEEAEKDRQAQAAQAQQASAAE